MSVMDDIFGGPQLDGRWRFTCHTCAADPAVARREWAGEADPDADRGHTITTASRAFAMLCKHEHEHRGHDAEVKRVWP